MTTKQPVGRPPRDPSTIRFWVDAYLTPAQIQWFESQGKLKSRTLIKLIDEGIKADRSLDDIDNV